MEESNSIINCPDCRFEIDVDGGEIGDYLECETCACEMTVTELEPAAKVAVLEEEK
jgi:hypothetical protein